MVAYIADDVIRIQPLTCFMCSPQLAVCVMINDAQYKSINILSVADVPIVRRYTTTLWGQHTPHLSITTQLGVVTTPTLWRLSSEIMATLQVLLRSLAVTHGRGWRV